MATILVIDSDPQTRYAIVEALKGAGHSSLEARNGQEGVELFGYHQPALVITEIVMPVKDGLETIGELRLAAPSVPIIAISAGRVGRGAHYLRLAQTLGADAAISKPFVGVELVETVQRLLVTGRG